MFCIGGAVEQDQRSEHKGSDSSSAIDQDASEVYQLAVDTSLDSVLLSVEVELKVGY